jgi:hypothetical protein
MYAPIKETKSSKKLPSTPSTEENSLINNIQSYIDRIEFNQNLRTLTIKEKTISPFSSEKGPEREQSNKYTIERLIDKNQFVQQLENAKTRLDILSSFMTEIESEIKRFINIELTPGQFVRSIANKVTNENISKKLWDLCTHIYDNVLKPISQVYYIDRKSNNSVSTKGVNETTTETNITYVFVKNNDAVRYHPFFKKFLIGPVLRLNYHYLNRNRDVNSNNNQNMDLMDLKDDENTIKKRFNGFNTCECIFENLAKLQDKITQYISIDEQLHEFVNTNIEYFSDLNLAYQMVIQLKLEQFLTLIDLCRINTKTGIEKLIKIIHEMPSGEPGTKPEITKALIDLLVNKLKTVNDVNQMDFADRDETFTEMFGQYEEKGKKEAAEQFNAKKQFLEGLIPETLQRVYDVIVNLRTKDNLKSLKDDDIKFLNNKVTIEILQNLKASRVLVNRDLNINQDNYIKSLINTLQLIGELNKNKPNEYDQQKFEQLENTKPDKKYSYKTYYSFLIIANKTSRLSGNFKNENILDKIRQKEISDDTITEIHKLKEGDKKKQLFGGKDTDYHKYIKYKTRYLSLKH